MSNSMSALSCRVCERGLHDPFFDLGAQPLANSLLDGPDSREERYPLALVFCDTCGLVQLNHTVAPDVLFREYVWVTGTSAVTRAYAEQFCDRLIALGPSDGYVLELASNDGTFLKPFMAKRREVLGIDPARNIAEMANENGVPTLAEFWTNEYAERLRAERVPAGFVIARNVVPHVAGTRDFIEGCRTALADNGVLAVEVHDARVIQKELHYDSIYHEHLCYFTFATLERLLNDAGLYIFDLDQSPINAGNLAVYASPKKRDESGAVKERRASEMADWVNTKEKWHKFGERARKHRDYFIAIIQEARDKGERVVGWGASARSSTLLNYCGIGTELISCIADKNPLKQGKYTAGTHIPIVSPEEMLKTKPDVVVLLAWNFADEIENELVNNFGFKGSYITPLPNEPHRSS